MRSSVQVLAQGNFFPCYVNFNKSHFLQIDNSNHLVPFCPRSWRFMKVICNCVAKLHKNLIGPEFSVWIMVALFLYACLCFYVCFEFRVIASNGCGWIFQLYKYFRIFSPISPAHDNFSWINRGCVHGRFSHKTYELQQYDYFNSFFDRPFYRNFIKMNA